MIYYVDKSCMNVLEIGDDDCISCFESLALNRRHCENILIAERETLDTLAGSERLSDVSRGVYRKLLHKASEFRLILNTAKEYCKIIGDGDTYLSKSGSGQVVINVSAKEMGKRDLHKLSILLAENTDDIDFYKILGKYYATKLNISKMNIDFERRLGGGSTTAGILENIITSEKNMCLSLIDSDEKYCGDTPGETLKQVLKVVSKYEDTQFFWEVIPLKVHEIENLIPVSVLEEVQKQKGFDKEGIEFIKFLIKKGVLDNQPQLYFDLKNGVPMRKFFMQEMVDERERKKFSKLEPYRQYWKKYIEEYGIVIENKQSDALVRGVCEKILKYAIEYLKKLTNDELLNQCSQDDVIEKYWEDIGSKILAWGCVGERLTV